MILGPKPKIMPKPISTDFRRRVVDAYRAGEGGYKKLAARFSLSWNSVRRWVHLEKTTNSLSPRKQEVFVPAKITPSEYSALKQLVQEKPDRTLQELASEWHEKYGTKMHISSMHRALNKAKLSFKKNL